MPLNLALRYSKSNSPFDSYKKNIYSQNGEDGIILRVLELLGCNEIGELWVVEFGAWDGIHLSNTFSLVKKGASAVYIESDEKKFQQLLKTSNEYPKIIPICALVSPNRGEGKSLDEILSNLPVPTDFFLLSIDIDSYDLQVWEAVNIYRPILVIIEIMSEIPVGVLQKHSDLNPGSSFTATLNVAETKGYCLVCHTGNLIFIREDCFHHMNFPDDLRNNPNKLFNPFWVELHPTLRALDYIYSFFENLPKRILLILKNKLSGYSR